MSEQVGKVEEAREKKMENEIKEEKIEIKAEEVKVEKMETKPEERKRDIEAICYIYTSFNNTIVHITDLSGSTLARITGGMMTTQSRLKANPTVAMFTAKRAAEQIKELGVTSLYVRVRAQTGAPAPGPGAHAAIRTLGKEGLKIISIIDTTKVPRGGPKKPYGKRGRRV